MGQINDSITLLFTNYSLKFFRFIRQAVIAYYIGVSALLDQFYYVQMIPLVLLAIIGGSTGEVAISYFANFKKKSLEIKDLSLSIFLISTTVGLIYFLICLFINKTTNYIDIDYKLFNILTIIFIFNFIVSTLVTFYQSILFITRNFIYNLKIVIISEIFQILILIFLIKRFGIYSLAISLLITSMIMLILLIYKLKFYLCVQKKSTCNTNFILNSISFLRKSSFVSLSTFFSHIATIIDRSVTFNYLETGYLSSLQYSKNTYSLVRGLFHNSVKKIAYIEQAKIAKLNKEKSDFVLYTRKIFNVLLHLTFIVQIIFISFLPYILALFFRRGKFTMETLIFTNEISTIVFMSVMPDIMLGYINQTFYALGNFKISVKIILFSIIVKIILIYSFINKIYHIIPLSILFSFSLALFFGLYLLKKKYSLVLLNKNLVIFIIVYSFFSLFAAYIINPLVLNVISYLNNKYIIIIFFGIVLFSLICCYFIIKNKKLFLIIKQKFDKIVKFN